MKQKLFVVLSFFVVFQAILEISVAEETSSIKPECPKLICSKIVCTGGVTPTVNSNGCPECPKCLQKPICEPPICLAVECPFGTTPQPTVLPNGCPGCRKCVKCVSERCEPLNCIYLTSTTLPNGCPGCPTCKRSLFD